MSVERVAVVGAGLVGTSIGLALARVGQEALLFDRDPRRAEAAAALGAGRPVTVADLAGADHVVVAVPPSAIGDVVEDLDRLTFHATISDVASIKSQVLADIKTKIRDTTRFCGGHPIAGRERGGPGAARPTLFDGAVWAVTPLPETRPAAVEDVAELARRCGARPVSLDPVEHDQVLAAVSHGPQLVASVLAAGLVEAGPLAPVLAASGFRDSTRLADADPELWTEIALANAGPVAATLEAVARRLGDVAAGLRLGDPDPVRTALVAGNRGRAALPGKHSAPRPSWARVGVVLADRPGELGRLLVEAGRAGVNVEDLSIDHAPDRAAGFVDLYLRPDAVEPLLVALTDAGWSAYHGD